MSEVHKLFWSYIANTATATISHAFQPRIVCLCNLLAGQPYVAHVATATNADKWMCAGQALAMHWSSRCNGNHCNISKQRYDEIMKIWYAEICWNLLKFNEISANFRVCYASTVQFKQQSSHKGRVWVTWIVVKLHCKGHHAQATMPLLQLVFRASHKQYDCATHLLDKRVRPRCHSNMCTVQL